MGAAVTTYSSHRTLSLSVVALMLVCLLLLGCRGGSVENKWEAGPATALSAPAEGPSKTSEQQPFRGTRNIVYACDASGSMIAVFAELKAELSKSIKGLKPVYGFNIIFFQDDGYLAVDANLLPVTPETKQKAFNFIDAVRPVGTTDPIPGIQHALRSQPEVIFLVTDGDFPDNVHVIDTLRRLNKDGKTGINTILFQSGDNAPTDTSVQMMEQIATENRGSFKLVNLKELD